MNKTVKIKNIPKGISNEYLMNAFLRFGDIREAIVFESGEGKVLFKDEIGARNCLKLLSEHSFYLGSSLTPVTAEMEIVDTIGMPEGSFLEFDPVLEKERSVAPYFAQTQLQLKFQKEWQSHFEAEKEAKENFQRLLADERNIIKNSQQRRATEELLRKHDELMKTFKKQLEDF